MIVWFSLWRQKYEMSRKLRLLASLLFLAVLLSLVASVTAFLLREVMSTHLPTTDVTAQLARFEEDAVIRERWEALQRTYHCCGGHENGYRDWGAGNGRQTQVRSKVFTRTSFIY